MGDSVAYFGSLYIVDPSDNQFALSVIKCNLLEDDIVWSRKYKLFVNVKGPSISQNVRLEVLPDKSIVLCTTVRVRNQDSIGVTHKGSLIKLDKDGDSLWVRAFGYTEFKNENQVNDFILTNDGGFLLGGVDYSYPFNSNQ